MALDLLDRPIAFQRIFVTLTGSVTAALFLSQAVYWHNRSTDGFHKTREEWEEETGLTRREQETARKTLRDLGILSETQRGTDRTIWYSVNEKALIDGVRSIGRKRTDGKGGNVPMERAESANCSNKETETTTETTTEKRQRLTPLALLPSEFRSQELVEAYESYERMRKERRLGVWTKETVEQRAKEWSKYPPSQIASALRSSVANGWQGVFPERESEAKASCAAPQKTYRKYTDEELELLTR